MAKTPLVIWVNSPPHVELGAFRHLEQAWNGRVVYAVLGEARAERLAMGWGETTSTAVYVFRNDAPVRSFTREVATKNGNALHLVAGLSSVTGKALSELTRLVEPERLAAYSESPAVYGPPLRRVARFLSQPIKYRYLVRKYRGRVGVLLPLGATAVTRFGEYGWPASKMMPFMYCPLERKRAQVVSRPLDEPPRFLYVGRLSRFGKGTDILLKAAEQLVGSWSLTIVGGHGDFVDEVKRWAAGRSNVKFYGPVAPDDVADLMSQHDVCVVPSRVDGWNVVVNEALYVSRGLIVTGAIGSDELVRESRAGAIIERGSAVRLAEAMQTVIDAPTIAKVWSARASEYFPLISPESVGEYLKEILEESLLGRSLQTRQAPWLDYDAPDQPDPSSE